MQTRSAGTRHLDAYRPPIRSEGALGLAEDCLDDALEQVAVARYDDRLEDARALAFYYSRTLDPVILRFQALPEPLVKEASISWREAGTFATLLRWLAKPGVAPTEPADSTARARAFREAFFRRDWVTAARLADEEAWLVSHPGSSAGSFRWFYPVPSQYQLIEHLVWGPEGEQEPRWDTMDFEEALDALDHARAVDLQLAACGSSPLPGEALYRLAEVRDRLADVDAELRCLQGVLGAPPPVPEGNRLASTIEMTFREDRTRLARLVTEAEELRGKVQIQERAQAAADRARDAAAASAPAARCGRARVLAARLQAAATTLDLAIADERTLGERYGVLDLGRIHDLATRREGVAEAVAANAEEIAASCVASLR